MKTKNILKTIVTAVSALCLTGCIEEAVPTQIAISSQLESSSSSQKALVDGLSAFMVKSDTYGVSANTNDWGYPCHMFLREVLCEDFPIYDSYYDYFYYQEIGNEFRWIPLYPFIYYYKLIRNSNNVIKIIDPETAEEESLNYLGIALTFRSLAYLDLTRMFEYKKTGLASLDAVAESNGCYGLTVPITTENTTNEQTKDNPRVPFYTMYRFIMNDLSKAETYLSGYLRSGKDMPDVSVVYALKARLWLEMGTRFTLDPEDLAVQLEHEADEDGYAALGIASAADCFQQAYTYAQQAIGCGYTPISESEWHDPITGFNKANNGWIWAASIGTMEQIEWIWYCWFSHVASETSYGLSQYGGAFRMISTALFSRIPDADWRKTTWVAPEDAGLSYVPDKYQTNLSDADWASLPAYANLKYHPGSGNITDYKVGLIYDVPLIRVEEMYLIAIEATARLSGAGAGAAALQNFINTYRYTDGSYSCTASSMEEFIEELMIQRRIEFWGEGILYFDYKRLKRPIVRNYSNSNWLELMQLNYKLGETAPWLNFFVPEYERDSNPAIIMNPDPSQAIESEKI